MDTAYFLYGGRSMEVTNLFYGFRGNITFPEQATIYNYSLQNDSASKNKIFR